MEYNIEKYGEKKVFSEQCQQFMKEKLGGRDIYSFTDSLEGQEGSSAISGKYDKDSYERKLVVDQIRSNPVDAVKTENKETVVYSETLEEFEKEYQAFIEMLKAQKSQK